MNNEENLVVGVDIGASKICVAVANLEGDQTLRILGFLEHKIKPEDEALYQGEIVNSGKTAEVVDHLLEELSEKVNFDLTGININISSLNLKGVVHKDKITKSGDGKNLTQVDVENLHKDLITSFSPKAGYMYVHTIPQDFYVNDIKITEKVDGRLGMQVGADFYFIVLPIESVENLYYTIKDISAKVQSRHKNPISIENLIVSPMADAFSLLRKENQDKRAGVAIVDIGADLTELIIFDKNGLRYLSTFPIAGNTITRDLAEAFNLQFDEAEKLKFVASTVSSKSINTNDVILIERKGGLPPIEVLLKNATIIIEWRLREIAALINDEIRKAEPHNTLTNGIILTGGTSSAPIIRNTFAEIFKSKNIRKGDATSGFDLNGFNQLRSPRYSTLLGLLKCSFEEFDHRIDNSILDHAPLRNQSNFENAPKQKSRKDDTPKTDFFGRIIKIIKQEDLNDKI